MNWYNLLEQHIPPSNFNEMYIFTLTNQKQKSPVVAMFVHRSGRNEQFYRGLPIDDTYQVSVHLAKPVSEEKIF